MRGIGHNPGVSYSLFHVETTHQKEYCYAFPKRTALEAGKHINNCISSQQMSKIQKDIYFYTKIKLTLMYWSHLDVISNMMKL